MPNTNLINKIIEVLPKNKIQSEDNYGDAVWDGYEEALKDCISSLPEVMKTIRDEIEKIDWKENHFCAFNDGECECRCLLKTKETIITLLSPEDKVENPQPVFGE